MNIKDIFFSSGSNYWMDQKSRCFRDWFGFVDNITFDQLFEKLVESNRSEWCYYLIIHSLEDHFLLKYLLFIFQEVFAAFLNMPDEYIDLVALGQGLDIKNKNNEDVVRLREKADQNATDLSDKSQAYSFKSTILLYLIHRDKKVFNYTYSYRYTKEQLHLILFYGKYLLKQQEKGDKNASTTK